LTPMPFCPYNKLMKKRLLFLGVALVLCGFAIAPLLGGTGRPLIIQREVDPSIRSSTPTVCTCLYLRPPGGKETILEWMPWSLKPKVFRSGLLVPRGVVHAQGWPYDQNCREWHYQGKDGAFVGSYLPPGTHVRVPWSDGTTADFIVDGPRMRPEWQEARDKFDRFWRIRHKTGPPISNRGLPPEPADQWPSVSVRPVSQRPPPGTPLTAWGADATPMKW
jgi:hypothetical protein